MFSRRWRTPLSLDHLEAVAGGANVLDIRVQLPATSIGSSGAIDAEHAADFQAAQYLHRDPSLDSVTYMGTGPDNRVSLGSYSRDDYNRDFQQQNFAIHNGEVVSNYEGSVNDRFAGLENPPTTPYSWANPSDHATFDERFNGDNSNGGGLPSWIPSEYGGGGGATRSIGDASSSHESSDSDSYASGPTQTFDDGSSLTTYDDGSTLAHDTDGNYSATPSYDDSSGSTE